MLCDMEKSSCLRVKLSAPSYHTISTSQAKLSRTTSDNQYNCGGGSISILKDNNQPQPAPPTPIKSQLYVTNLHLNLARVACVKKGLKSLRQAAGIRDLGCLLLASWYILQENYWHRQRVINCFRNRMEKLGLRCFLQLVKKTSQSHEFSLSVASSKSLDERKELLLRNNSAKSLCRMIIVIFLNLD